MSAETTYKKMTTTEEINVGDIIMLDLASGYVTKAVANTFPDYNINSKLVIGVCTSSDNNTSETLIIDCGDSEAEDVETLDCGDSEDQEDLIYLYGGDSEINPREIITVAYTGEQWVNYVGKIMLGDKLSVSREAGKVTSKEYLGRDFYELRSIGKAIKINDDQVKVLLDIE